MFYDLMEENPDDDQAEFYHYATFSNALQIGKTGDRNRSRKNLSQ